MEIVPGERDAYRYPGFSQNVKPKIYTFLRNFVTRGFDVSPSPAGLISINFFSLPCFSLRF